MSQYKDRFAWALLWRAIYVLVPLQIPLLTGLMVDSLSGNTPTLYGVEFATTPERLFMWGVYGMFGIALLYGLSAYMRSLSVAQLSRKFVCWMRDHLFGSVMTLGEEAYRKYGTGDLLDRIMSDTGAMRRFIERVFIQNLTNALRVIYPIATLLLIDLWLALAALSVLPVQWFANLRLQKKLHSATKRRRNTRADLVTTVKENLDGVETLQSLHAGDQASREMSTAAEMLEEEELRTNQISATISGIVWTTTSIGIAITWLLGGGQVLDGTMTVGTLVTLTGFVTLAYQPFRQMTKSVNTYQRGLVSLERIQEILDESTADDEQALVEKKVEVGPQEKIREDAEAHAEDPRVRSGQIAINDVSYQYPDGQKVLYGISTTIEPNQLTVLVGRSGCGKSTLLKLLAGMNEPNAGQIRLDGQSVQDIPRAALREMIATVPQQPAIFSGTVRDNLHLADPNATQSQLKAACRDADALSFICDLEDGFDTQLGRGGVDLSGGQKQRIAIARGLLRKAHILLLDEPTSALDQESSDHMIQTFTRIKSHSTVVLVSHNPQVIQSADRILVLDEGGIAGDGTHDELIAHNETYQELFGISGEEDSPQMQDSLMSVSSMPLATHAAYTPMESRAEDPRAEDPQAEMAATNIARQSQQLGYSEEGRPITVELLGNDDAAQRILLLGGQHGDEPMSTTALQQFSRIWRNRKEQNKDVQIAILPCLNPDGAAINQRTNANGTDLNRDHQQLVSAEVQALHQFVRKWQPNFVVDTHTYPARRKHLLQHGMIYYHDIFLDAPNHPVAVNAACASNPLVAQCLEPILRSLTEKGILAERYTIINRREKSQQKNQDMETASDPVVSNQSTQYDLGRVRHSTPDPVDARNGLTLRYGCTTLLLEGREPTKYDDPSKHEQVLQSMVAALHEIVSWVVEHPAHLQRLSSNQTSATSGNPDACLGVPLRYKYIADDPHTMLFLDSQTRTPEKMTIPSKYTPNVKPTTWVKSPMAYAVPIENRELLLLLERHGFGFETSGTQPAQVEKYVTKFFVPPRRKHRAARKSKFVKERCQQQLSGYWLFSTDQSGGSALATLLEPQSKTGLSRYPEYGLTLAIDESYPILRVVETSEIEEE